EEIGSNQALSTGYGMALQNGVIAFLIKVPFTLCKSPTLPLPKQPQTITLPPPCLTEGQHPGVASSLLTLTLVFCGYHLKKLPVEDLSLHGFVPVTPEAEAPRCAKAASRCFSLRCDRHKVLTWEWMGASCYLRLGAALKRPV
ncbi:unnamed protein product, partial [Pleuronectes platessa]